VRHLRVFAIGGYLSYRALFGWLSPGLFVIILLVPSVTQIFFFAYLGRSAGVEDDAFYVIGNAVAAASIPCLFGMSHTITDERYTQTLATLIVSPASRVALFLGRALPATVNGVVVAVFALTAGAIALGVAIPAAAIPGLAAAIAITSFSCTGLGLVNAALGLRWRETAVLTNVFVYFLLLVTGVNVPLDLLPDWLATMAQGLPVTHGVEAAREAVGGATVAEISGLLAAEALIGAVYTVVGLVLLRLFEREARRGATLEVA
jgi:ABC-2 type transport system permease protein